MIIITKIRNSKETGIVKFDYQDKKVEKGISDEYVKLLVAKGYKYKVEHVVS